MVPQIRLPIFVFPNEVVNFWYSTRPCHQLKTLDHVVHGWPSVACDLGTHVMMIVPVTITYSEQIQNFVLQEAVHQRGLCRLVVVVHYRIQPQMVPLVPRPKTMRLTRIRTTIIRYTIVLVYHYKNNEVLVRSIGENVLLNHQFTGGKLMTVQFYIVIV